MSQPQLYSEKTEQTLLGACPIDPYGIAPLRLNTPAECFFLARLAVFPLWFDDTPAASLAHIRATATNLALRNGLDAISVDYLQFTASAQASPHASSPPSILATISDLLGALRAASAASWAGEKLFPALNHRYNWTLSNAIATNFPLKPRLRSRLTEDSLAHTLSPPQEIRS